MAVPHTTRSYPTLEEPPRPPPYRKPPSTEKRSATFPDLAPKRPRLEFGLEFPPLAPSKNVAAKRSAKERDIDKGGNKERQLGRSVGNSSGSSSRIDAIVIDDGGPSEVAPKHLWSAPEGFLPAEAVVIRKEVVDGTEETRQKTTKEGREQALREGFAAYVCPVCCGQLYQFVVSGTRSFTMCPDKKCPYPFNLSTEEMKKHFSICPEILWPNTQGIKLPPPILDLPGPSQ